MYSINFTESNNKLCLSLHYNGANSYLIEKFINLKQNSEIVVAQLCLENISTDWLVDNMKKTGLNGYAYDSSADYDAIAVDNILDIHKDLMKKNDMI